MLGEEGMSKSNPPAAAGGRWRDRVCSRPDALKSGAGGGGGREGAALRAMMGDEGGMPDSPGVSWTSRRPVAGMEDEDEDEALAGVTWTCSVAAVAERVLVVAAVGSLLTNLRGRADAGTTEALEGGTPAKGDGCDCAFSDASASLYRLLTGVAFTCTPEGRLDFFNSAKRYIHRLARFLTVYLRNCKKKNLLLS